MNHSGGTCSHLPIPEDRVGRTTLLAIRRMAVNGLRDANACWLMLDLFSTRFRRPLVLLRAFVMELSHSSCKPIRVAACCAPRMTQDEASILRILSIAALDAQVAQDLLMELTRNTDSAETLSAAVALSRSFVEDLGPQKASRASPA